MQGKHLPTEPLSRDLNAEPGPGKKVEKADEAELKERQVFKLKRPEQDSTEAKEGQPSPQPAINFKFSQPVTNTMPGSGLFKFDPSKVNADLFGLDKKPAEPATEAPAKKPEDTPQPPAKPTEDKKSAEDKKPEETDKKTVAPLFSSLTGSNLFGSFGSANERPKEGAKGSSLFGDLGSQNSIFGGVAASTGLFGNSAPKSNLFDNPPTKTGLFGNLSQVTQGLGNGAHKNSDEGSEGEDGASDEEREASDEEAVKKNAVVHHSYESPYYQIIMKPTFNFRLEHDEALGAGFVAIEKLKEPAETAEAAPEKTNNFPILVFRNKAKNILHSSTLVPKVSACGFIKNRKDAVAVTVFYAPKATGEAEKPKPAKVTVKVLFNSEQDAEEFKEALSAEL